MSIADALFILSLFLITAAFNAMWFWDIGKDLDTIKKHLGIEEKDKEP